MEIIHGGDIYRNQVTLDYSVNVNPLGIPVAVKEALNQALSLCDRYPDPNAQELREAVSQMLLVPREWLIFGNGASELFMAVVHAIQPKKTVIPGPSFYGYEYATKSVSQETVFVSLTEFFDENSRQYYKSSMKAETNLLFLANPNNPTGERLSKKMLIQLLTYCKEQGILVVLDECFIEFCEQPDSMLPHLKEFPNLILVRAFTKIFSIPGVRLGYLVNSCETLLEKINRQLPEWNTSCFAQAAGCACAKQTEFIKQTAAYVKGEREFLKQGLLKLNIAVMESETNFMLLYDQRDLYQLLLEKGILIRDCENFRGLKKGYYRIAVKTRKENEILLEKMGELK